jgi:hypothetical protein
MAPIFFCFPRQNCSVFCVKLRLQSARKQHYIVQTLGGVHTSNAAVAPHFRAACCTLLCVQLELGNELTRAVTHQVQCAETTLPVGFAGVNIRAE